MAVFKKLNNGRYTRDGKMVSAGDVPSVVRENLDTVDPGSPLDENGEDVSTDEDVEPAPGPTNDPTDEGDDELDDDELDEDESDEDETDEADDDESDEPEDENEDEDENPEPVVTPKAKKATRSKGSTLPTRNSELDMNSDRAVEQSEPGMGFPRKNGKTVDVFDGKTPHTHVKYVDGLMVPLSEENYHTKTDADIIRQLEKLKLV